MTRLLAIALLPLLAASCSTGGGDAGRPAAEASAGPLRKSLLARMNEQGGYKQDANGNWVPQSNRRSEFEDKGRSSYAGKSFAKQPYQAGDYAKQSFWGKKDYRPARYAGDTDGSRFQTTSPLAGRGAREAGTRPQLPGSYQTGRHATGAAREAATPALGRPSDDLIENRRASYQQPAIVGWEEQRQATIEQARGVLSR